MKAFSLTIALVCCALGSAMMFREDAGFQSCGRLGRPSTSRERIPAAV